MKPCILLVVSACLLLGACKDDAVVTARAQGRVNLALSTDSDVQVDVRDGHATLTGLASSEGMHARAVQAARSAEGVTSIDDEIKTVPSLTGAQVPR